MDPEELTRWFMTRRAAFHDIARRIVGSQAAAEDVVQDAWLKSRGVEGATLRAPLSWFAATIRHLAIDRVRHERIARRFAESWIDASRADASGDTDRRSDSESIVAARTEAAAALTRMVAALSELEVVVLLLLDVFGEDHAHIARSTGRSVGAIRVLVHRARQRLDRDRDRDTPQGRPKPILAVCCEALQQRDATMLHAVLADIGACRFDARGFEMKPGIADVPPACIAFGRVAGRSVLVLRQGSVVLCTLPVGVRAVVDPRPTIA